MRAMAVTTAAVLALTLNEPAFAQSRAPRPPAGKPNRAAAPIDKTVSAAPVAAAAPDLAYGAFQRGYFLTARTFPQQAKDFPHQAQAFPHDFHKTSINMH